MVLRDYNVFYTSGKSEQSLYPQYMHRTGSLHYILLTDNCVNTLTALKLRPCSLVCVRSEIPAPRGLKTSRLAWATGQGQGQPMLYSEAIVLIGNEGGRRWWYVSPGKTFLKNVKHLLHKYDAPSLSPGAHGGGRELTPHTGPHHHSGGGVVCAWTYILSYKR